MRSTAALLPLVLVALAAGLASCRGRPGHPVLTHTQSARSIAPPATRAPEPPSPTGMAARALIFLGMADAESPLRLLKQKPTPRGSAPQLVLLPRMERAVLRRFGRGGPRGPVRNAAAFGFSAFFPLPPRQVADLLLDPQAEKEVLAADRFDLVRVEYVVGGFSRRVFHTELKNRGQGPARFDFRFDTLTERWDCPDGVVILRHDPVSDPPPVHVTLYRGATLLEPVPGGAQVTEFLVVGTDVAVPFFLRGAMRSSSLKLFSDRITNLWRRAVAASRR